MKEKTIEVKRVDGLGNGFQKNIYITKDFLGRKTVTVYYKGIKNNKPDGTSWVSMYIIDRHGKLVRKGNLMAGL